jgi:hypothetical protein
MDENVSALLHVQSSLLMAFCATHPNPQELERAFDFHLAQSIDNIGKNPQLQIMVSAWASTFRVRMHTPDANAQEGESNPTG